MIELELEFHGITIPGRHEFDERKYVGNCRNIAYEDSKAAGSIRWWWSFGREDKSLEVPVQVRVSDSIVSVKATNWEELRTELLANLAQCRVGVFASGLWCRC